MVLEGWMQAGCLLFCAMPSALAGVEYPSFLTATNLEWKPLLHRKRYKDVVIQSLRFLVKEEGVLLYSRNMERESAVAKAHIPTQ